MPRSASHGTPATRARLAARRAGHLTLAGAASVAMVGLTAPAAQAHNHNVWDRVAQCESNGRWDINTGNGYYGGLQFYQPTWVGFGGQEFAGYAHQATKLQQITVAQRVLQVQGPGAWPVCSVRAGLTRENGAQPYPGQPGRPAPTPPPAPAPPPGATGTWVVTSSVGANIRSGPGTTFGVVGGLGRGTQVTGVSSNGWVHLSNGRGWVSLTTLGPVSAPRPPAPTPPPAPVPPGTSGSWVVSSSVGANIRSGPGTTFGVVGGAGRGTQVSGTASNGWVRLADGRGFISLTTLRPASGTPAPTPPPSTGNTWRVSAAAGANIRSGPGTSHGVIGGVGSGTQVRGTLHSNGWVQLSDRNGWIYSGILTRVG